MTNSPQLFAKRVGRWSWSRTAAVSAFAERATENQGDFAYALWSAETADNVYEMATDTHVVRDGKIVAQSFAGQIKPKR